MSRQAQLVVTLSAASTVAVTVPYHTVNGTAVAPSDYTAQSGTLTFTPGEVSKVISITIRDDLPNNIAEAFTVVLGTPTNATILDGTGVVNLSAGAVVLPEYYNRFNWMYDKLHDNSLGYFGPQTGANAFAVPRHIPEVDPRIINEAPDYGGQSVSETASFWVALETWKGLISEDWAGYSNAWNKIEQFYIPSAANQPIGTYNAAHPADFVPEQDLPSLYPPATNLAAPVGNDPLYGELLNTYGTPNVYLMHWLIDVEGAYGFKNGTNETSIVFMNTFERGKQESSYETVPHPAWDNWSNGGGSIGYAPLFTQGTQVYPTAPYNYSRKWSYTNAPDAEVRAIQWAFHAKNFAAMQDSPTNIEASTSKAKKLGDYTRYNLFDKYFVKIGENTLSGANYNSCHYLINWYASWGGGIPANSGGLGSWSFRIGCSESHQGYQSVMAAYIMATGGGGMIPQSPSAGAIWLSSLYRQIEMIRWLQSPQGPIAGGVTNSYGGRYATVTGRPGAGKFYGMDYVYSPVWGDPPSNNWVGFQAWGQNRTADLFLEVSDKSSSLATAIRPNLEIILDRLVGWFLDYSLTATAALGSTTSFRIPATLNWVESSAGDGTSVSSTPIPEIRNGVTVNVYERLPNLNWNGTGDYSAFWNASTVPNTNLICNVVPDAADVPPDLGVASAWAYLLIAYAKAKQNMNKFDTDVVVNYSGTNKTHTAHQAFDFAKLIIDRIWDNYRDTTGIATNEKRADYRRMAETVYVPSTYVGTTPKGDAINSASTFISIRSFLETDPKWAEVQAYIAAPIPSNEPTFRYHRFWAQVEFAVACAALQKHFSEIL